MTVSIIAAVAANGAIGKDGKLLWHLPDDLKRFKELTTGKPVIMGRKTFESIGRALPNRLNIVLSKNFYFTLYGRTDLVRYYDLVTALQNLQIDGHDEVFIIGGAEVYREALQYAERIYITNVYAEFPDADTFFPTTGFRDFYMESIEQRPADERHAYNFDFINYKQNR